MSKHCHFGKTVHWSGHLYCSWVSGYTFVAYHFILLKYLSKNSYRDLSSDVRYHSSANDATYQQPNKVKHTNIMRLALWLVHGNRRRDTTVPDLEIWSWYAIVKCPSLRFLIMDETQYDWSPKERKSNDAPRLHTLWNPTFITNWLSS